MYIRLGEGIIRGKDVHQWGWSTKLSRPKSSQIYSGSYILNFVELCRTVAIIYVPPPKHGWTWNGMGQKMTLRQLTDGEPHHPPL